MTDSEYLALAEAALAAIESGLERATNESGIDVECSRSGNVLDIEFIDNKSKIIVNTQAAMQEIWVAARSGGFHYRYEANQSGTGGRWLNTRDGSELFGVLSELVAKQGGVEVQLVQEDGC